MKKSILLFAAFLLSVAAFSQATYNVVIFSEDGEPFYAYVNGIKQNNKPETNIKVTGLTSEALNVRVEFENKALPKLKQNMMPEPGFEHTINIRRSMKKELKMTYFGKVALDQAPKGNAKEIPYHTAEDAVTENSSTNAPDFSQTGGGSGYNTGNGGVSVTSSTTTTQVNTDPTGININMGGNGINVNMGGMGNTQTTTSSTITTTTSSGYTSTSTGGATKGGTVKNPNPNADATTQPVAIKSGCSMAMSEANYQKMKKSVEDKPFSDTKMSTAKIATKNNCMSSAQIKGICELFNMDDDKLAYAKFAYDYCADKGNYYTVSEIFSFSTTTDKFNQFLESK